MSIPEFILRKLVLPGSLKRTPSGFTFILHNTFAPANINKIQIFNGDEEIPPSQITINEPGQPTITAAGCSPENPLLAPVNIDITISANSMTPLGVVTVKAVTKEVGVIEFSIEEIKKKKRSRTIPGTWTSNFRQVRKASVVINLEKISCETSPYLLGQFVEHLERCVYDGIWTKDGREIRTDTADLIKQLNPPMIRYPGGNFASGYHWEDGIGPKNLRPRRHDAAWQAEESNQVGTDEFLAFCEQISTIPCIVVNDGSGTPFEAAKWVSYCNSPEDTEMGKLRTSNGHPRPYNVKYWGVGNEVWGAWQIGTTSAAEYVKRLKRFVTAMKEVDPTIEIIAVGNHPLTDDPDDPASTWNMEVLLNAGDLIDFISWHIYQPEKEGWEESPDDFELFRTICAAPLDIDTYLRRIKLQITDSGFTGKVYQALDEWNVWLPPKQGETSMHRVTYTMRDALYVASVLAVLFRNSDTVRIANLAQLVNVLPLIQTNESAAIVTAIYYPFILFNQMLGSLVNCSVTSPDFDSKAMGPNISEHKNVKILDCLATLDNSSGKLSAMFINRDPLQKLVVDLKIDNQPGYNTTKLWVIKANHPLAANTFEHPYRVRLSESKIPKRTLECWKLKMEPASIYLVEFEKN